MISHWLDRLEGEFGDYSIPNLTNYLIAGQVIGFFLFTTHPSSLDMLTLRGDLILSGQLWRIFTFLFYPISTSLLWAALVWYFYYLLGSALESQWGSFKYLVYVLVALLGTLIAALIFPTADLTNGYLYASIFLAVGYLFPDFQLLIFFIIPVKIKWLAALMWIGIIVALIFGAVSTKVLTLLSIANFILFFGEEIFDDIKTYIHHGSHQLRQVTQKQQAYHICAVCGMNEVDNPKMEIRYCSKCNPSTCYCGEHINQHAHVGTN